MSTLKIRLLTLCVLGVFAIGAQAFPGFDGMRGSMMEGGKMDDKMLNRLSKRLELSDEQQAEIKALVASRDQEMEGRMKQMKQLRKQLHKTADSADFDEKAARKTADEISELGAEAMVQGLALRSSIRAILTPEQREKMAEMRGRMKERNHSKGRKGKAKMGHHRDGKGKRDNTEDGESTSEAS